MVITDDIEVYLISIYEKKMMELIEMLSCFVGRETQKLNDIEIYYLEELNRKFNYCLSYKKVIATIKINEVKLYNQILLEVWNDGILNNINIDEDFLINDKILNAIFENPDYKYKIYIKSFIRKNKILNLK